MENEEKTVIQKDNYERLIFAIAVLFAQDIGMDIEKQTDYSDLSPQQKTFADKILKDNPSFVKQIDKDKRISEQTIVKDVAKVEKKQEDSSDLVRIITVGDDRVCDSCKKWNGKVISLSGANKNYPSLKDFINSDGLHYGCRCALQELSTDEIPLKEPNPRREGRAQIRPDIYNSSNNNLILVFN